jgi:ADP-ribose pyrophosphatase YjhB (NUDIX family)
MPLTEELYRIADELRSVACVGLQFAKNPHDTASFERVLALSARLVAMVEQRPHGEVIAQYQDNLQHLSPLIGAEAAVFRRSDLLLIKRRDDGLWALPGGLTEVGETLAESAQRELHEETGIQGRVAKLLGIFDSRVWHSQTKAQLYHVIFLVEAEGGTPAPSFEATDVGFFGEDSLPPLSAGHHLRVPFVFAQVRGKAPVPYFDLVDDVVSFD